jgi:cytochrome c oxidase assembly protein subunit 15
MNTFPQDFSKNEVTNKVTNNWVKTWLVTGLVMIFVQVVVGGITRLTGSGLSITKWDIVTGALPPLNEEAWQAAFSLYKTTPQYAKINDGMVLGDFKFIFFWEYIHRLWARWMGLVFLIPFLIFWRKGWLLPVLMKRLGIVVVLAILAASFGWIMVASGLIDRPWVSAYKLTLHLSIAFSVFSALLWATLDVWQPNRKVIHNSSVRNLGILVTLVGVVQIMLGGVMSGMKAGLFYPTFPLMNGSYVPNIVFHISEWNWSNFENYDKNAFMPALIQAFHRNTAYLLTILSTFYFFKSRIVAHESEVFNIARRAMLVTLGTQVLLGILTLVNCVGKIPVALGVLHQGTALILLTLLIFLNKQFVVSKQ